MREILSLPFSVSLSLHRQRFLSFLFRKLEFLYSSKFGSVGQEEETESDVNQSKSSEQLISSFHFFSSHFSQRHNQHDQLLSDTQSKEIIFSL
jgi:hypothetical protein